MHYRKTLKRPTWPCNVLALKLQLLCRNICSFVCYFCYLTRYPALLLFSCALSLMLDMQIKIPIQYLWYCQYILFFNVAYWINSIIQMVAFGICCIIKPRKLCSEDCIAIASCCQKGTNWLISQKTRTYFFWLDIKTRKNLWWFIILIKSHSIFWVDKVRREKNNNLKGSLKLAQSNCAKFPFFETDYIGLEHWSLILERQLKLDAGYEMHCCNNLGFLVHRILS